MGMRGGEAEVRLLGSSKERLMSSGVSRVHGGGRGRGRAEKKQSERNTKTPFPRRARARALGVP